MRLIDADALKEEINKKRVVGRFNTLLLIDNAPTVEPICPYLSDNEVKQPCIEAPCERPRGKWKKDDMTGILDCALCGGQAPIDITSGEFSESPYCPWCGADMRGKEE